MRLYNLDYLRGLAAFSIMLYHYSLWTFGNYDASTILGRIGIYGVSIFYVLSGLTMYHVYHKKMNDVDEMKDFFKKRAFRIFPLLWLVTIAQIVISKQIPALSVLILNLTGFFGLFAWDQYIAVGAWSIGNELVFYLFVPLFIFLLNKIRFAYWFLIVVLFSIYCFSAFYLINGDELSLQWHNYVNPLNQIFLFSGGFTIGVLSKYLMVKKTINFLTIGAAISLFVFSPANGNPISIVTDWSRLFYTMICFMICFSFYKLTLRLPKVIEWPLTKLGEACYSIYLVHPLVYSATSIFILRITQTKLHVFILSIPLTFIIGHFVYQYFEKYFIDLARKREVKTVAAT